MKKDKASKKVKKEEAVVVEQEVPDTSIEPPSSSSPSNTESDPGDLSNFHISEATVSKLQARGVDRLFPVQYKTFNEIMEGMNVIAQAHTGTGKTFGFAIPIVEKLQASKKVSKAKAGRKPSALVLAPTRELAKQIATDFEAIISGSLTVLAVYGGTAYEKHTKPLAKGVDIVVGAPGRVKDLMNQGCLSLENVRFVVLDEVDRMLDMGFRDDVDLILGALYPLAMETETEEKMATLPPQTMLFSATLPPWVTEISQRYLCPGGQAQRPLHQVCLTGDTKSAVGDEHNKTASSVEHLALQCPWQERPTAISDVIRCYNASPDSRCIVFCERKKDADELAAHSAMSSECHVLHGDIPQDKRELVLEKFRSGKYRILVTTNVAARGLDIPAVDLVIQCRPPADVEDYIHRSGRTGRAGRAGRCICFYTPNERPELQRIETMAGITFRRINCPTAADIVKSSEKDTIESLSAIPEATWQVFQSSAASVIEELGAERAVACALAKLCGKVEELRPRSVLTTREGYTAYMLKCDREDIRSKGYAYRALARCLPETTTESISHLMFIKDKKGFVFDLPSDLDSQVSDHWQDGKFDTLEPLTEIPELAEDEQYANGRGGGGGRGNFRGGRGRGGNFRSFDRNGDSAENGNNFNRGRGRGGFRGGRGGFSNGDRNSGDQSFSPNGWGRGRGRGGRGGNDFRGGFKRPYNGDSNGPDSKMVKTEGGDE